MAYLDNTGLGTLWGRIKTYIASLGYTSNVGTVTGVKMNNGSAISPVNGVVDLGIVITSHQDIGGKQDVIDSSHKLSADFIADGTTNKVYTATEQTKLNGIAANAEVNVQANWNETNTSSDAYIQNKPTIPEAYSLPTASADTLGGIKVGANLTMTNGVLSANAASYESKVAASGGTDVSLCTTGEKYIWNNKQDAVSNIVTGSSTSYTIWTGTEAQYGSVTKDANTIYFITPSV